MIQLSIIVPAYNVGDLLGRCLESIRDQHMDSASYEVILVNDGSTDNTLDVAESYARTLPLRIFSQTNRGQSSARNLGIDKSQGEWVCFVDSDDALWPDSLPKVLQTAVQSAQMVTYRHLFNNAVEPQKVRPTAEDVKTELCSGADVIEKHNPFNYVFLYLIRRSFLQNVGLRFEVGHYCEDSMFTINLLLLCDRCVVTNIIVYNYIVRPCSTMTNQERSHLLKMVTDYEYIIDYFTSLSSSFKDKISEACYLQLIDRKNAFTFFMLMKCMRAHVSDSYLCDLISRLRQKRQYPFTLSYGGKFPLLVWMANHATILRIVNALYRVFK